MKYQRALRKILGKNNEENVNNSSTDSPSNSSKPPTHSKQIGKLTKRQRKKERRRERRREERKLKRAISNIAETKRHKNHQNSIIDLTLTDGYEGHQLRFKRCQENIKENSVIVVNNNPNPVVSSPNHIVPIDVVDEAQESTTESPSTPDDEDIELLYCEESEKPSKGQRRTIVVDGCNVASGCKGREKGILLVRNFFKQKGFKVKIFVPQYMNKSSFPLLQKWFSDGDVVFTPSRKIGGRNITSYDDRMMLEYARACGGIVVSQDQYRDLYQQVPKYRNVIENCLLVPTFVENYVMFPNDPLGRGGPTLGEFLRH